MRPTMHPDIRNELWEIAPNLARMERQNPFAIPQHYFAETESEMLSVCRDETPICPHLNTIPKANPFCVPTHFFEDQHELILLQTARSNELSANHNLPRLAQNVFRVPIGYFDELYQSIIWQTNETYPDQTQSTKLSHLLGTKTGFVVPTNYFAELEESIMLQISQKNESTLNLPPQTGFKVPNNYFDDFANNILAKAKANETTNTNEKTTLASAGKEPGFVVPTAYFKRAAREISDKVRLESEENEAKQGGGRVVPMNPQQPEKRTELRQIVRYALATAAMFAFAVIGLQFFNQPSTDPTATLIDSPNSPQIASNDIVNQFIGMSDAEFQQKLDEVSVKDIEAYINENIDEFDSDEIEAAYIKAAPTNTSAEELNLDRSAIKAMLEELD